MSASPELLELARATIAARGQNRAVLSALLVVACELEALAPVAVLRYVRGLS